jgi:hypothetical protein
MGVPISLNSYGARGAEILMPKPAGRYRIVLAGDSFTLGWGVRAEDTFSALLRDSLATTRVEGTQDYEAINLGVGNYNTVQQVARIRDIGLELKPDLIILAYYLNDAEPTPRWRDNWFLANSYLVAFLVSRWRHVVFRASGAGDVTGYYHRLYRDDAHGWQASVAALHDLAAIARRSKIPTMVFIIPDLRQVGQSYPFLAEHALITARVAEAGLPVVDLRPYFDTVSTAQKLWVTNRDAHPNGSAHAIIAAGMLKTLSQSRSASKNQPIR